MMNSKKTNIIIILGFLYFSLSAFSSQLDQKPLLTNRPITHFNVNFESTPTLIAIVSDQSTVIVKVQKNIQPTKTPKPTSTPPVIPPPADPGATSVMIILAVLMVMVILFGFWLNRRRVF